MELTDRRRISVQDASYEKRKKRNKNRIESMRETLRLLFFQFHEIIKIDKKEIERYYRHRLTALKSK